MLKVFMTLAVLGLFAGVALADSGTKHYVVGNLGGNAPVSGSRNWNNTAQVFADFSNKNYTLVDTNVEDFLASFVSYMYLPVGRRIISTNYYNADNFAMNLYIYRFANDSQVLNTENGLPQKIKDPNHPDAVIYALTSTDGTGDGYLYFSGKDINDTQLLLDIMGQNTPGANAPISASIDFIYEDLDWSCGSFSFPENLLRDGNCDLIWWRILVFVIVCLCIVAVIAGVIVVIVIKCRKGKKNFPADDESDCGVAANATESEPAESTAESEVQEKEAKPNNESAEQGPVFNQSINSIEKLQKVAGDDATEV
eukprot:Nk52_evm23s232 gene=Nk52_evmTU23s232